MTRRLWAGVFFGSLAVAAGWSAGCSSSTSGDPTPDGGNDAAVDDTIKIGVIFTQSPPTVGLAGVGQQLRDAVLVAQDQINRRLVLGKRVQFLIKDDQNSDTVREKLANDLADVDGVSVVIGALGSDQTKNLQKVLHPKNVTVISPSSTSPDLSGNADNPDFQGSDAARTFLRTVASDSFQGKAAAIFARRGPITSTDGGAPIACDRLAIIELDNSYGRAIAKITKDEFIARGGTVVLEKTLPQVDPGDAWAAASTSIVNELFGLAVDQRPQCQVIPLYEPQGAAYMKAFETKRQANASALVTSFFSVGTDGVYSNDFLKYSRSVPSDPKSPSYAERNVFGTAPDTAPMTREYEAFRSMFTTKYPEQGSDAPSFGANAFDAAILAALGTQVAGDPRDRQKVREGILAVSRGGAGATNYGPDQFSSAVDALAGGRVIKYVGASGNVTFDANGDVTSGMVIWHTLRAADNTMTFETKERFAAEDLK
jgi:ABC-type branched-subunit amino acid transport system substrate-binding protein